MNEPRQIFLDLLSEEKILLLARCVYERLEQIAPSDGETWDDLDAFDKEGYRQTVLAVLKGVISLPVLKGGK